MIHWGFRSPWMFCIKSGVSTVGGSAWVFNLILCSLEKFCRSGGTTQQLFKLTWKLFVKMKEVLNITLRQKPTLYPENIKNLMFKKWVNFVKNETLKMWIFWKMRLWKCEFCEKWNFENMNFWMNWGFLPQCGDHWSFMHSCLQALGFSKSRNQAWIDRNFL